MRTLAALALAVFTLFGPALAVEPEERLADPTLEARAREISKELRCLVCQNQSIDDSDADLARDLRILVRERLLAGDDDAAVLAYVVDRYGDFVLLRPPVKGTTYALWAAPAVVLMLAIFAAARWYRRPAPPRVDAALSADERAELDALMREMDKP